MKIDEKKIEEKIEKILTHPGLLFSVSLVLNANSTLKIFQRRLLEKIWNQLELPNKEQQDRLLHLMHQMDFRIRKLESELTESSKDEKLNIDFVNSKKKKVNVSAAGSQHVDAI